MQDQAERIRTLESSLAARDQQIARLRQTSCRGDDLTCPCRAKLKALRSIVDAQAEDEGLWFVTNRITESYLQQALRNLHTAIEGKEEA